jgi:putative peptide zinc metalloprotease protein
VALRYFQLRDEDCSILQMLDGRATREQITRQFEKVFAPLTLSSRQLHAFLFRLHELGLVVSDAAGQGDVLRERDAKSRRTATYAALANPLAIRLPGIAAGPIVEWLYPRLRWLFGPLLLVLCAGLIALAGGLVVFQFGALSARLPAFREFFSPQSAALFVVVLIAVKALHELGHALACRHFGGRPREIGVLLLVFSPTLYCDVTDAWRLDSKWRRIAISSAGMLVELVLASVATLLWWFSMPGLLNDICLRVMFLCSVSTILFNVNPLLKSDGYYILSDLVEVPNLWQQSRDELNRTLANSLLGMNLPDDPTLPPRLRGPLLLYAAASVLYGVLLVTAILWFCFRVAEPQGLAPLASLLAMLVLGGMAVAPVRSLARLVSRPDRRRIRRGRAGTTLVIALTILALALFVPLPHRIAAPTWLEPAGAQPVYVSVPGRIVTALAPGSVVKAGEEIAHLESDEISRQVAALAAAASQQELRLANLRLLQADDPTAGPQIPAAEKSLDDARQQLAQWREDQARLRLSAPVAGTVLPPPIVDSPRGDKNLAGFRGTPLDPENRGAFLPEGTLVCLVGDPARLVAMLVIEQSDVAFVRVGQRVRIRIDQGPVIVLNGKISELARADADDLPERLAGALDLALHRDGRDGKQTVHTYYQARVELHEHHAPLAVGMHGQAKILANWEPLAPRLWRLVQRTFRLG